MGKGISEFSTVYWTLFLKNGKQIQRQNKKRNRQEQFLIIRQSVNSWIEIFDGVATDGVLFLGLCLKYPFSKSGRDCTHFSGLIFENFGSNVREIVVFSGKFNKISLYCRLTVLKQLLCAS